MSSLYLANDFTIKIIFPPNEGSARESWEEELNFVRILGLIERMQRRLAESERPQRYSLFARIKSEGGEPFY